MGVAVACLLGQQTMGMTSMEYARDRCVESDNTNDRCFFLGVYLCEWVGGVDCGCCLCEQCVEYFTYRCVKGVGALGVLCRGRGQDDKPGLAPH
jgi:hypothetical protein